MVKILAIGDAHGYNKYKKSIFKDIDLILLPGDLGCANLARKFYFDNVNREKQGLEKIKPSNSLREKMYMETYHSALDFVSSLSKFAPVYLIYGNVEYYNSDVRKIAKKIEKKLPFMYDDLNSIKNVRIINNRIANFNGIRIGGLEYFKDVNWIRDFKPSDYQKEMKRARKQTDKAKRIMSNFGSVDILLCHQPPYGILDKVGFSGAPKHWLGKHAGSKVILDYIKRKQPKYVLCGHIHEEKGNKRIGKTEVINLGCSGDYKIIEIK